jgi:uncharacterized protein YbcI
MIKQPKQEDLLYLSSTFSKLLKRRFGKGPETCFVMFKGTRLYVYIRKFITPAEEVLIGNDELNLAINFRSSVIGAVIEDFIPEVSKILDGEFRNFLHDWNYDANTGVVLLEKAHSDYEAKIDVFFEDTLFNLIEGVGSRYHRRPTSLKIVKFTQNICAIESKEVLLPLENLVYQKGNQDLLLYQAREIKRGYFKHKSLFEDLFNRLIEDMFIMWDYESDRNYIIFIFTKEEYLMN